MWKKWIIGFFLCTSIVAFGTVSNATLVDSTEAEIESGVNIDKKEVDTSKYELINPEKKAYTSNDKVTFINGKAPSDTSVTIKVYGTTDLTRKNFDLHTLPTEDDYIESYSVEVVAGNMGFFDKQLDLVSGINKIVLNFNVEGVPDIEVIVFVQTNLTKTSEQVKLTNIIPMMK